MALKFQKKYFIFIDCFFFFCFTGGSTGTQWLSSGTLWSVSTLVCQRTRLNVATRTASWATFSPRTTTTWTSSSSKGKRNGDNVKWSPSTDCSDYHWIQRNTSSNFCVSDSFFISAIDFWNNSIVETVFLSSSFRMVPFLTELRAVMDWVWTDTTLSLSNWICVEDIYANIFILKCWRESEKVINRP